MKTMHYVFCGTQGIFGNSLLLKNYRNNPRVQGRQLAARPCTFQIGTRRRRAAAAAVDY